VNICKLSFFHLIIWVRFPYVHLSAQIFILNIFCLFVYLLVIFYIFKFFFIDFYGYYIAKTDEGQPRPKYIFNKCGTNIYFFTLQRFGPSPSPNFKRHKEINDNQSINNKCYFPIYRNSRVEFQEEKSFTKKMTRGLVPVWSYWTSGSLADHFLFRQHSSNYLNTQCKLIGVYIDTKNMTFLLKFWFTRARDLKTSTRAAIP